MGGDCPVTRGDAMRWKMVSLDMSSVWWVNRSKSLSGTRRERCRRKGTPGGGRSPPVFGEGKTASFMRGLGNCDVAHSQNMNL